MDILSEFIIWVLDSSSGTVVRLLEVDPAEKMTIICWFAGILAQNLSIIENKINRVRGNLNYHDKLCSVQLRLGLIMVSFGKGMPKCHI